MSWPTIIVPRQKAGDYDETDYDYLHRNLEAAVWLLDNFEAAVKAAFAEGMKVGSDYQEGYGVKYIEQEWTDALTNIKKEFP